MPYQLPGSPSVPTQPGQMGSPYPAPSAQSPYGLAAPYGQPQSGAPASPYGPMAMPSGLSPTPGWMGRSVGLSGNLGMMSPPGMGGMPDAHANLAAAQAQTLRRPTYYQARPAPAPWRPQRAPMAPNPWGGQPAPMPGLSSALRGF